MMREGDVCTAQGVYTGHRRSPDKTLSKRGKRNAAGAVVKPMSRVNHPTQLESSRKK